MLLVTPALVQEQEQEQEQAQEQSQDQEQNQLQEQKTLPWNYFSTNLFVFLDYARILTGTQSHEME